MPHMRQSLRSVPARDNHVAGIITSARRVDDSALLRGHAQGMQPRELATVLQGAGTCDAIAPLIPVFARRIAQLRATRGLRGCGVADEIVRVLLLSASLRPWHRLREHAAHV
jgi:hypothetical protein